MRRRNDGRMTEEQEDDEVEEKEEEGGDRRMTRRMTGALGSSFHVFSLDPKSTPYRSQIDPNSVPI